MESDYPRGISEAESLKTLREIVQPHITVRSLGYHDVRLGAPNAGDALDRAEDSVREGALV